MFNSQFFAQFLHRFVDEFSPIVGLEILPRVLSQNWTNFFDYGLSISIFQSKGAHEFGVTIYRDQKILKTTDRVIGEVSNV